MGWLELATELFPIEEGPLGWKLQERDGLDAAKETAT